MNPVVVFLSIAFWGWLWGILGVLIAVPLLVILKVFSDHIEGLGWIKRVSGGERPAPPPSCAATKAN